MGGAFPGIPEVGQTVGVPGVPNRPRPALLDVPRIVSPITETGRAIGQAGEDLGKVLVIQGLHKNLLDSDTAEENFKAGAAQALAESKALPGDQQAAYVAQKTGELQKQILEDPANAHIAPYLQQRLPKIGGMFHTEAIGAGVEATMREQAQQWTALSGRMEADAGSHYTINPDGTVGDSDVTRAVDAKAYSQIHQMWPNNPQQEEFFQHQYELGKTVQRANALAADANNVDKLPKYVSDNPVFEPSEITQLFDKATETLRRPAKNLETVNLAKRANLMDTFYDQQSKGQLDTGAVARAYANRDITAEQWHQLMGTPPPFEPQPSDPKTVAMFTDLINDAHDPITLDHVSWAISNNPDVHGEASGQLNKQISLKKAIITNVDERAKADAMQMLDNFYDPVGQKMDTTERMIYSRMKMTDLSVYRKRALDQWKADTAGSHDPVFINQMMQKAIKDNPVADLENYRKQNAPKPAATPPPATGGPSWWSKWFNPIPSAKAGGL